jgi:fumarylacetoacetase
MGAVIG